MIPQITKTSPNQTLRITAYLTLATGDAMPLMSKKKIIRDYSMYEVLDYGNSYLIRVYKRQLNSTRWDLVNTLIVREDEFRKDKED